MPPRKRAAADDEHATTSPRAKKAAKTENGESPSTSKAKGKGVNAKSAPKFEDFKSSALPIHVSFTHTPPSIEKGATGKKDAGYIGNLTLVPTLFKTDSYGWKGTKRITVELKQSDGTKEKVTVQIQVNGTVHGSKNAKKEGEDKGEGEDDDEEDDDDVEHALD